jgi:hypothetical protein
VTSVHLTRVSDKLLNSNRKKVEVSLSFFTLEQLANLDLRNKIFMDLSDFFNTVDGVAKDIVKRRIFYVNI